VQTDWLIDSQKSTARITGALAHELNNPLQGILSLLSVMCRECEGDERFQVRLEQIRSGLIRLSRILESFSVTYENLPRPPDETTVGRFVDHLLTALAERQLHATVESLPDRETVFYCMSPELARLIGDAFCLPGADVRGLRLAMSRDGDGVTLICGTSAPYENGEEWLRLDEHPGISGVAGLINELARLAGGEAEFQFDETTLHRIRLRFRTEMSPA
jgi:signal transduction histidine kinase